MTNLSTLRLTLSESKLDVLTPNQMFAIKGGKSNKRSKKKSHKKSGHGGGYGGGCGCGCSCGCGW